MIAPRVTVVSEMPASTALSRAVTCIGAVAGATVVLAAGVASEVVLSVVRMGASAGAAELVEVMVVWVGLAWAVLPDGQMTSASWGWPIAHTRGVPGSFATEYIALSRTFLLEMALGTALQADPFQCCVEAT
jgi:hypothetical protein